MYASMQVCMYVGHTTTPSKLRALERTRVINRAWKKGPMLLSASYQPYSDEVTPCLPYLAACKNGERVLMLFHQTDKLSWCFCICHSYRGAHMLLLLLHHHHHHHHHHPGGAMLQPISLLPSINPVCSHASISCMHTATPGYRYLYNMMKALK
ncbi:hypothetical protein EJ05DRAFT_68248 [Pseudovirgaria hyperparasitica]|uniref:Uncharacterized protein n=1 Tax=Pseudovirgaria hyperparasitica TaxID=470096 RepID=A0A6A6W681_9PEZI|nr:uncharacterized protein EJ05DRAFT_68248 [Pseudovirgaria hyperparasitica]KAF2756571.1 hypothetical protein EJ05DRAFT_68248 [Pseudovirgaria hyperparasitica]